MKHCGCLKCCADKPLSEHPFQDRQVGMHYEHSHLVAKGEHQATGTNSSQGTGVQSAQEINGKLLLGVREKNEL